MGGDAEDDAEDVADEDAVAMGDSEGEIVAVVDDEGRELGDGGKEGGRELARRGTAMGKSWAQSPHSLTRRTKRVMGLHTVDSRPYLLPFSPVSPLSHVSVYNIVHLTYHASQCIQYTRIPLGTIRKEERKL
jgi:hypothetical protein